MKEKQRYRAVFFDLDGTLCNTLADLTASLNYALRTFDHPTYSEEAVRTFIGNGLSKLIERALPDADEPHRKAVLTIVNAHYKRHCADRTLPYPGIPEALAVLRARGYRLAVLTNKPHKAAAKILETLFLPGTFDWIAGHRDGMPHKPDPKLLFMAAEALKLAPESIVYVGDSDVDVRFSENAGTGMIGCAWGFRGRQHLLDSGAPIVIDRPEELTEKLQ